MAFAGFDIDPVRGRPTRPGGAPLAAQSVCVLSRLAYAVALERGELEQDSAVEPTGCCGDVRVFGRRDECAAGCFEACDVVVSRPRTSPPTTCWPHSTRPPWRRSQRYRRGCAGTCGACCICGRVASPGGTVAGKRLADWIVINLGATVITAANRRADQRPASSEGSRPHPMSRCGPIVPHRRRSAGRASCSRSQSPVHG
jgi:hypothetical protein